MVCPYCGYEKNEDSDTVCRSCNRRIKYDIKFRKIEKQKIYHPGITRTEILHDWSKVRLREYYERFCPEKFTRRLKNLVSCMWVGVFGLAYLLVATFIRRFFVHDFYDKLNGYIFLFVLFAVYLFIVLSLEQEFKSLGSVIGFLMLAIVHPHWMAKYWLLLAIPAVLSLAATYAVYRIEEAYRTMQLDREVYGTSAWEREHPWSWYSISDFYRDACPKELVCQVKKAKIYMLVADAMMLYGYIRCIMEIVAAKGTYEFEADVGTDIFLVIIFAVASQTVYFVYLFRHVEKLYSAGFFFVFLIVQIWYVHVLWNNVDLSVIGWIVPAAAVLFLQKVLRRVVRAYDKNLENERRGDGTCDM